MGTDVPDTATPEPQKSTEYQQDNDVNPAETCWKFRLAVRVQPGRGRIRNMPARIGIAECVASQAVWEEIDVLQLAASPAMSERNQADGRMVLRRFDWSSVCARAERLSVATTTSIGVRTVDLLDVAMACTWATFGLVTADRQQRALARVWGLDTVVLLGSTRP